MHASKNGFARGDRGHRGADLASARGVRPWAGLFRVRPLSNSGVGLQPGEAGEVGEGQLLRGVSLADGADDEIQPALLGDEDVLDARADAGAPRALPRAMWPGMGLRLARPIHRRGSAAVVWVGADRSGELVRRRCRR